MTGLMDVRAAVNSYVQWATDPQPRIGFGLPFLDEPTNGGLAKGECLMMMACSHVGKTTVFLNMIANNANVPAIFFSLEMSARQVIARLTSIDSGLATRELERELKSGRHPGVLFDAVSKYQNLLIDDTPGLSTKDMVERTKQASERLGAPIRLIGIDYLELIGGSGMLGKAEQVDKAAIKIGELAKLTDASVVVLHQVGKSDGSGGHEPLALDSGRYGGHTRMDQVVGLYAPRLERGLTKQEYQDRKDELFVQLLKNRSTGEVVSTGERHRLNPVTGRLTPWMHTDMAPVAGWQPELTDPTPSYFDDEEPF